MWREAVESDDIPESGGVSVFVDGEAIALFRDGDEIHAVSDTCTHAGASLSEGGVRDGTVRCPRHGAPFDLRTGEALGYPATEDVRVYETKTEGGVVYVRVNDG